MHKHLTHFTFVALAILVAYTVGSTFLSTGHTVAAAPVDSASQSVKDDTPLIHVRVVYVSSIENQFTPETRLNAHNNVQAALDWWQLRHDVYSFEIVIEEDITVEKPLNSSAWAYSGVNSYPLDYYTIFVVCNENTHQNLLNNAVAGYAVPSMMRSYVVSFYLGSKGMQALLAHETGHTIYNLPDWYLIEPSVCNAPSGDIMCMNSLTAYRNNTLGYRTLKELGRLTQVFLPVISTSNNVTTDMPAYPMPVIGEPFTDSK